MTFRAPGEQDAGQEECVGAEWGCLGSRLPSTSRAFGWSQDPLDWVVEVLGGGPLLSQAQALLGVLQHARTSPSQAHS